MISSSSQRLTGAWILLVAVTLISFFVAEHPYVRIISIAAVLALSGYKVLLVLYRFMELGKVPIGLRLFFNLWVLVCVSIIFGLYWYAL